MHSFTVNCEYNNSECFNNSNQLNMFRAIILPIFKRTRLCITACGIMHPWCSRPVPSKIVGALYHTL